MFKMMFNRNFLKRVAIFFLLWPFFSLSILAPVTMAGSVKEDGIKSEHGCGVQRFVHEGIAVEFSIDPILEAEAEPKALIEGKGATVRFKITDTATGSPMTGLYPLAWMDVRRGDQAGDEAVDVKWCSKKIQSFMQGLLQARPAIDLNTYYILALNRGSDISVIDPIYGFGGSKLLTLMMLKTPGEDWVLTGDRKWLFVSMPMANQVAVIDTATWKIIANIDAGLSPARLSFQPDEKYLWVGNDASSDGKGESGVTVIDAAGLKIAAQIPTGRGRHEIAFSDDSRYAFVTSNEDGTLSIIDVQRLTKIKEVKIGRRPVSLAFSPLSKAVYISNEADGNIVVVDGRDHKILMKIKARPGLGAIRFAPGDRFGFVINSKEDVVLIFDSSTNQILQALKVGKGPDQISFTRDFAYIRSRGTTDVSMIQLAALGKEKNIPVLEFPGGQIPPGRSSKTGIADSIVPGPDGGSVLVANPMDKIIYYYEEGMAAPMGSFQSYGREPMAVLVMKRNLRETEPGIYSTNVNLARSGRYDVAFLLDSPRIVHCFETSVKPNPVLKREERVALKIEPFLNERRILAGEDTRFQFKLIDPVTNQPKAGIKDMRVLISLAPGVWQRRDLARSIDDGVYEVVLNVPKPGIYYLFFESRSLGAGFNQLPYLILQATDEKDLPAGKGKEGEEEIR